MDADITQINADENEVYHFTICAHLRSSAFICGSSPDARDEEIVQR
jgi:hypothetical protein